MEWNSHDFGRDMQYTENSLCTNIIVGQESSVRLLGKENDVVGAEYTQSCDKIGTWDTQSCCGACWCMWEFLEVSYLFSPKNACLTQGVTFIK